MSIGRAGGRVDMRDINAYFSLPATQQIGLGQIVNIYGRNLDYGEPYPEFPWQAPTQLSGRDTRRGFWGYTHRSANFDGVGDYLVGANTIDSDSTYQPQLTDSYTLSMWVRATRTSAPAPGYAIPLFFVGGQNGFTGPFLGLYYSGRLTNGATENLFIARMFRAAYASGPRRDYRFRPTFSGGSIWWGFTNNRSMNHILLQYDGAGGFAGAFRFWWNGVEVGVYSTNNLGGSGGLVWTGKNLRASMGGFPYNGYSTPGSFQAANVQFFRGAVAGTYYSQMYNNGAGLGPFAQSGSAIFHYYPLYLNGWDQASAVGGSPGTTYNFNTVNTAYGNMRRPVY